jgi:5-methylcytosine-specific restriction endonuclease McrA
MAEWNECFYCGRALRFKEITFDHVIPKSWGGHAIVTACKECNNLKGESSVDEFREFLGAESFHGERMGWTPW